MTQTIVVLDKERDYKVQVSSNRQNFPSCCGIDIYTGIGVVAQQPADMRGNSWTTVHNEIMALAEKEKDLVFEKLEEQMMLDSRNRGVICASDGVITKTDEPKTWKSMGAFLRNRGWCASETAPNPVHGGHSAVFLAWKKVEKIKPKPDFEVVEVNDASVAGIYDAAYGVEVQEQRADPNVVPAPARPKPPTNIQKRTIANLQRDYMHAMMERQAEAFAMHWAAGARRSAEIPAKVIKKKVTKKKVKKKVARKT